MHYDFVNIALKRMDILILISNVTWHFKYNDEKPTAFEIEYLIFGIYRAP